MYWVADCDGNPVDFLLCAKRDHADARRFLGRSTDVDGVLKKTTIDTSRANTAAVLSMQAEFGADETHQSRYLDNIVEQDHRTVKRIVRPTLEFENFRCKWILFCAVCDREDHPRQAAR